MTPFKFALARGFAFLLLPLSLVPIYLALPRLKAEFGDAAPAADRHALPPPKVSLSSGEKARWERFPLYKGAIPVLAYHGINARNDVYSVSRRSFAAQMEMLYRAGFRTVSIEQYVRFLRGDLKGLPARPLLITFDDGRLDSYRGADLALARYGFRATMFVIAGEAEKGESFYLNWEELRRMSESGRWDVQEHAGEGHHNVRYERGGETGPFYAFRRLTDDGLESFAEYRHRVVSDVLTGRRLMGERLPGYKPLAFAVPYGNYGQQETNDPRIPPFLKGFLMRAFDAVFIVKPAHYTTASTSRGKIGRYEVRTYTTAGRLYDWLRSGLPLPKGVEPLEPTWCHVGWQCVPELASGAQVPAGGA